MEWLVILHNGGMTDTPLIEHLRTMDLRIPIPAAEAATMHYVLGSAFRPKGASADPQEGLAGDYMPIDKSFGPGAAVSFSHYIFQNGQHTDSYLPFFDLQWSGGGAIGAVGWTGQWAVQGRRTNDAITLRSGQETTHFKLHPGESIRTSHGPLLIEWRGSDWIAGQNALRRVLIAHYLPRAGGKIPFPPVAHTNAYALIFDDIARKTGKNPLQVLPTLRQWTLAGRAATVSRILAPH